MGARNSGGKGVHLSRAGEKRILRDRNLLRFIRYTVGTIQNPEAGAAIVAGLSTESEVLLFQDVESGFSKSLRRDDWEKP